MVYIELASIKRQAAAAAQHGKEFDWTRYHELKKQLENKCWKNSINGLTPAF
jgi:predicted Ser/Thr protein kinase